MTTLQDEEMLSIMKELAKERVAKRSVRGTIQGMKISGDCSYCDFPNQIEGSQHNFHMSDCLFLRAQRWLKTNQETM